MWEAIAIVATIAAFMLFALGAAFLVYFARLVDSREATDTAPANGRVRGADGVAS